MRIKALLMPIFLRSGQNTHGDGPDDQRIAAAGIRTGQTHTKHWAEAPKPVDAYMAKADANAVLGALGAPVDKLQVFTDVRPYYHPGRAGELRLGPKNTLARFGEINPRVLRALGVKGPVVAFEIYPDAVPTPKSKSAARRSYHCRHSNRLSATLRLLSIVTSMPPRLFRPPWC